MIIFGATLSPFVRKAVAFATEKGIDFEVKPVNFAAPDADFVKASPFRKIPALMDGDFTVADSTAIITYLEAIKPDPNLIPADPQARATTIWFDEFADTIVGACSGKIVFNRIVLPKFMGRPGDLAAADAAEANDLPTILNYLESIAPKSGFLVEDRLTLADIAVASPFASMSHAACAIDGGKYPKSKAYIDGILARPSFADVLEQERPHYAA